MHEKQGDENNIAARLHSLAAMTRPQKGVLRLKPCGELTV
jgi:hypothetical protein